ncbi:hypothetical protein [Algoriphagus sp. NG3]|uniref:hypothetical protein n=1 Tax=Algoriphagus sp. NG3 TaxID=3097546 RepID=UPI002A807AF9|nr:hypothetical protein [Algoriphagus sp. NG3]WPR73429.1 hypothetical protein SLW71_12145 [Algoriphagus sp. NG3]
MDFDLSFTLRPNGEILYQSEMYDLESVKELILETETSLDAVKINLVTDPGISMGDLSDFQAILRDLDIRRVHYVNSARKISKAQEEQKAKLYSEVKFRVEKQQEYYQFKNYSELTDKERSMLLSPPAAPQEIKETDTDSLSFADERRNDIIPHISFSPEGDPNLTYNLFTESYVEELTRLKNGKGSITITPAAIYLVDISNYADPVKYFTQKFAEYESLRSGEPHYVNKSRKDQAILEALYFELSALYSQFSEEMKSEVWSILDYSHYPLYSPIYPYYKLVKDREIQYKKGNELNDVERKSVVPLPPGPPSDWKTKYPPTNSSADKQSSDPVAEQKDDTSERWPPAVKAARIQQDLQSYVDAHATYEKLRKQAPHFVKRSKAEQDKLTKMYSDLRSMYYHISFYDKPKVDRPMPPLVPYLKLESNGEVYYKLAKDLTAEELSILPPPPPPLTPEEQVEAYKKVFYQYELMRNKGRNDAHLSMAEREAMFLMYNELQEKFLYMDAPERRQVKMVNFPYYQVEEDGKVVFKAVSELTPEQRALNNC